MNAATHNFISVDFHALFIAREPDAMTKKLLHQFKQAKSYLNVKIIIPYNLWHYHSTFDHTFFIDTFKTFIEPKLASIFGHVNIELTFSRHLSGNNLNIVWGANINYQGTYNLTIDKQKVASFNDYCVVDSLLLKSFGVSPSKPFEILVEDGEIELLKGNDDYRVNGLSLIAKEPSNSLHFNLQKDTKCS